MRRFYTFTLVFTIFFFASCSSKAVETQTIEATAEYVEQDSVADFNPSVDSIEEPEPEEEDPRAGWEAAAVSRLSMILNGDWPRTGISEKTYEVRENPCLAIIDVDDDEIPELLISYLLHDSKEEEVYNYDGVEYAYAETILTETWIGNGGGMSVFRYKDSQTNEIVFVASEYYPLGFGGYSSARYLWNSATDTYSNQFYSFQNFDDKITYEVGGETASESQYDSAVQAFEEVYQPLVITFFGLTIDGIVQAGLTTPVLSISDKSEQPYTPQAESEYLLPESDKEIIDISMLAEMSADELRLARNEIFARHGYVFIDSTLQEYFLSKSWYQPGTDNNSIMLNDVEKRNIDIIKNYEPSDFIPASSNANGDYYVNISTIDENGNLVVNGFYKLPSGGHGSFFELVSTRQMSIPPDSMIDMYFSGGRTESYRSFEELYREVTEDGGILLHPFEPAAKTQAVWQITMTNGKVSRIVGVSTIAG